MKAVRIAVGFVALAGPTFAAEAEFREHRAAIVAEVEDATLRNAEIVTREGASGGKAVGWKAETGRAEFAIRVFTPGTWHVWIRTAAPDHLSNGLFLELNGVRQRAPAGHAWAGADSIYLRKHPTNFSWKPEWQGPGEGNHAGPITIEISRAGLHRLALIARKIERPTLDKIILTREATPPFVNDATAVGPPSTRREPIDP
jgi:hypothetical protein